MKQQTQQQTFKMLKESSTLNCKENNVLEHEAQGHSEHAEAAHTKSGSYEKKRTANLENLIGNIKVRKLNQGGGHQTKDVDSLMETSFAESDDKQMTSLYVDIVSSECSASTPPLSSPSVSPSSLSIAPDSPVHASSSLSSSSSSNNKSRYSMLNPKFRWIMESSHDSVPHSSGVNVQEDKNDTNAKNNQALFDSLKNLDAAKIKQLFSNAMPWCGSSSSSNSSQSEMQQQQQQQAPPPLFSPPKQIEAKKTHTRFNGKKCNSNNSLTKQACPPQHVQEHACDVSDPSLNNKTNMSSCANNDLPDLSQKYSICPTSKNQEDPTRQIKFYDDFIDFRGDILRRPPDSKNCRILWEYLYLLLQNTAYASVIRWEDESQMVFRIVQAEKLAALWGLQKNRLGMTYEKLSRGMRYYYPNNIIAREAGRRLLYRFMRHPNEIKKFVKKNGTYMLKRAKLSDKSGLHLLDATCATDNDMDAESIKTDLNREESSVDEESSFYEHNEPLETRVVVVGKHLQRQIKKENKQQQMHSKYDNSMPPATEDIENENFYDEDEELDEQVEEDERETGKEANPTSALGNGINNTYPDLYADMLQYYQAVAAAAAAGLPANYFSKLMPSHSTKDDVSAAAQHLMQMRHQEAEAAAGTQFLNETIKNFAHSINLQRGQQLNASINCSVPAMTNKGRKNARSNDLSSCSSTSSISSSSSSSSSSGCAVKEEPIHYPNSQGNFVDINNNNHNQLNKKMQLQHDKSFRNVTMNKNNYEFGLAAAAAAYQNDDTRGHTFYQSNLEHPLNLSLHNNNNNNNTVSNANAIVKKRKSKYDVTSSVN